MEANANMLSNGYELITSQYGDKTFYYKIFGGTAYNINTPDKVVRILDSVLKSFRQRRIRVFYGNSITGKDWCEENDVIGYVGRSTGSIKIPLLIKNINSSGGGGILDHCIVKITEDKKVLYQHPNYHIGELEVTEVPEHLKLQGYTHSVKRDGITIANFKTEKKARNYIAFLKGERNRI